MFDLLPFDKMRDSGKDLLEREFPWPRHNFFNTAMELNNARFKTDIKEIEDAYILEAELPGVDRENIDLEINSDYLTIRVNNEEVIEEDNDNYIRKERHSGTYQRNFRLNNVKVDDVNAEYINGILHVNLPKAEKSNSNRKIDIE